MTQIPHGAEVKTPDGHGRIQEYTKDGYIVMFNKADYHGALFDPFTDHSPTISKEYTFEEVTRI